MQPSAPRSIASSIACRTRSSAEAVRSQPSTLTSRCAERTTSKLDDLAIFDSNKLRAFGTSFADITTLKIAGKNDVGVADENPNGLYLTKGDCANPPTE